jgi:uncharacterized protein (DUF433 family)
MATVALDTNVVVALVDDRDTWHATAVTIRDALIEAQTELVYFDCVFNETIGVIGRRTAEQKRPEQFDHLLDGLTTMMPPEGITWIGGSADPLIMGGRACIRGMRIPVSIIASQIAYGAIVDEVLDDYPDLEPADIEQALHYSAWLTREEVHPA